MYNAWLKTKQTNNMNTFVHVVSSSAAKGSCVAVQTHHNLSVYVGTLD